MPLNVLDTTIQCVKEIQINISKSVQIQRIQMPPQILAIINTKEMNAITSPSAVLFTTVMSKQA
jgi:hypothetical protein